jgi:hypothetical protein
VRRVVVGTTRARSQLPRGRPVRHLTFDGSSWTAPVNIDSEAAKSVSGPVLKFLMSVSCHSAKFCVAGDSIGDAFVRS